MGFNKKLNFICAVLIFGIMSGSSFPSIARADDAQKNSPTPSPSPSATPSPTVAPSPTASPSENSATDSSGDQTVDESVRFSDRRNHFPTKHTKIYNAYVGVEGGYALASGTYRSLNSSVAYGVDAGIDTPLIGYGLMLRHELLPIWNTNSKESITQLMLELNVFSYLLLNGGIQVGDVVTSTDGNAVNSLGMGFHVGFDLHFTKELTAGLGAYWTYVTQNADKHSLFNIMIPLKYWF